MDRQEQLPEGYTGETKSSYLEKFIQDNGYVKADIKESEVWRDYEVLSDVIYHSMTEQGLEFCEKDCNHISRSIIRFITPQYDSHIQELHENYQSDIVKIKRRLADVIKLNPQGGE